MSAIMAASTLALGSAAPAGSTLAIDSSKLSSRSAFGSSIVQFAPVRRSLGNGNRVAVVKAKLSEDQSATGKKILASFLAAGAALSIAGQALAGNPFESAKNKADEVVSSAQDAVGNLPNLPKIELPNAGALQSTGEVAEGAIKDVRGRMDGIFGKNKPFPQGRVASTNGGTGSAIGDAKKRIESFGKNPFAENLTKTTQEFEASIPRATGENSGSSRAAREFLGQDSTRVDAATEKVNELGDNFKSKASNAFDEAKGFVGSMQKATPELPSPDLPTLPNPLEGVNKNMQDIKGKIGSAKEDLVSKASDIKGDVASNASSAIDGSGNEAVEGVKNLVESNRNDMTGNVASKVDDVKGVSSEASNLTSIAPTDVVDGAKDLVGSAQDAAKEATSNFPSIPNPFESIRRTLQGKADNVASKVDDVKGDVSSKASDVTKSRPDDIVDGAKNLIGSVSNNLISDAADGASLDVSFGGLGKKVQENADAVKDNVASKVDVPSNVSGLNNSTPDNILDGVKNLVGSIQDGASNFPNVPNPLEELKNLAGKSSDLLDNGPKAKASLQ